MQTFSPFVSTSPPATHRIRPRHTQRMCPDPTTRHVSSRLPALHLPAESAVCRGRAHARVDLVCASHAPAEILRSMSTCSCRHGAMCAVSRLRNCAVMRRCVFSCAGLCGMGIADRYTVFVADIRDARFLAAAARRVRFCSPAANECAGMQICIYPAIRGCVFLGYVQGSPL